MKALKSQAFSDVPLTAAAQAHWAQIDWCAPWLAPYQHGQALAAQLMLLEIRKEPAPAGAVAQGLQSLNDALLVVADLTRGSYLAAQPAHVRFVPQAMLPAGMAYEAFIHAQGCVPTRDNFHDFFNGLAWMRWPLAKRRMNQLQAQVLASQGVGSVRGPLRDALTLLDESGAVLQAPEPIWQALLARQWRRLFVDLRPLWSQARLCLIGHAAMEKLVNPRKPITVKVYCPRQPLPAGGSADLDAWLAADMTAEHLAKKPFTPLPVLGVPGWWAPNDDFCFYDDLCVFRPPAPV